jgi:putative DNA-invertase from lambdoid prophage Rac
VLVTEFTRWGRSTQDLMGTLGELAGWEVSLIAQTGLHFDLATPQGKLIANLMSSLAEFEHDLLRERAQSGIAAARARARGSAADPATGPRISRLRRWWSFLRRDTRSVKLPRNSDFPRPPSTRS